jgi:hypothetical protein
MKVSEFNKITGMSGAEFSRRFGIKETNLTANLRNGKCKIPIEELDYKHKLFKTFNSIIQRCYNKNHKHYKYYGGRGIKMSGEFFYSFKAFIEYMGEKPGHKYTIDRIDNDGNYERGNLRWATKRQQAMNRKIIVKNKTGHINIVKVKSGKYHVVTKYCGKTYSGGTYESINNAISSKILLKYRLENGFFS